MKNKKKIQLLLLLLGLTLILLIPSSYAFYFSKYESLITSILSINSTPSTTYVRASVLTYWVDTNSCTNQNDLTTCDIYGRSAWTLKSGVINSNWTLSDDGYYYYNSVVDINNPNIVDLIDPNLTITDLTDDYLLGTNVVPQYEVLYEYIEKK